MRLRTQSNQQQRKSTGAAPALPPPSSTPPASTAAECVAGELKQPKQELLKEPKAELKEQSAEPTSSGKNQSKTSTTPTAESTTTTTSIASGVCYCNGERELGGLEVQCTGCKRWFHQSCFRNLDNFGGLPFMVSYVFSCQQCAPEGREKWSIRSTSYSSMAVMSMANMTFEFRKQSGTPRPIEPENPFFSVEQEIVKYMEENWDYLSTTPKRQKKTWYQTILKILQKETELFEQDPGNEGAFALKERDLLRIGPMHESVVQLFKRNRDAVEREANALQIGEQQLSNLVEAAGKFSEGPKTRGASKRKAAATTLSVATTRASSGNEGSPKPGADSRGGGGGSAPKKAKTTSEFATVQIDADSGATVDFPFNREGYRYYLVEKDPNIQERGLFDTEEASNTRAVQIPAHIYRLVIPQTVTLSPNDRANQLLLDSNHLTVTGNEGYSMARATHSVSHGSWYYEMEFLSQPGDAHVRVGWAQSFAVLQACVGYSKFSYGWRSKRGTAFHDGNGHHYHQRGFRQGDVVGCLICLPSLEEQQRQQQLPISEVLPASRKDCDLIKFKQTCFFEEKEETQAAVAKLQPLPGSKIEFFLNGQSCGAAFTDIYAGHYFPAVSLFQSARVRVNFGPQFRKPPQCLRSGNDEVKPMSARPEQMLLEQSVADMAYLIANEEEVEQKKRDYFDGIQAKEAAAAAAAAEKQQQQAQQKQKQQLQQLQLQQQQKSRDSTPATPTVVVVVPVPAVPTKQEICSIGSSNNKDNNGNKDSNSSSNNNNISSRNENNNKNNDSSNTSSWWKQEAS